MRASTGPFVVDNFFESAAEMRAEFDSIIGVPGMNKKKFVWDLFHSDGDSKQTYLRSFAEELFSQPLMNVFMDSLSAWGRENLGVTAVRCPWLSCYIHGCGQDLHTDLPEGTWSYVFSLTDWVDRCFDGGELYIHSANDTKSTNFKRIVPAFNRLAVFNGQQPHYVQRVEDAFSLKKSRVVLHGLFIQPTVVFSQAIIASEQDSIIRQKISDFQSPDFITSSPTYVGLKVNFNRLGIVSSVRFLGTNVLINSECQGSYNHFERKVESWAKNLRIEPLSRPGQVVFPLYYIQEV